MSTGSWASDKHPKCAGIAAWSGMLWNNTQVTVNQKIMKLVSKRKTAWLSLVHLSFSVQMVPVPLVRVCWGNVPQTQNCKPRGSSCLEAGGAPTRGFTNLAKLFVVLQKRKKNPETLTCKTPCSLFPCTPGCFCNFWQAVETCEGFSLPELVCLVYLHCHPQGSTDSPLAQRDRQGQLRLPEGNKALKKAIRFFPREWPFLWFPV